jgi:hypothetical protein
VKKRKSADSLPVVIHGCFDEMPDCVFASTQPNLQAQGEQDKL